jgi:hypothetical protein
MTAIRPSFDTFFAATWLYLNEQAGWAGTEHVSLISSFMCSLFLGEYASGDTFSVAFAFSLPLSALDFGLRHNVSS